MEDFYSTIIEKERANEGADIYLFFNRQIGLYTSYGVSAFLVDHLVDGVKSFSDEYQMPVMIVTPQEVLSLRNATNKLEHEQHRYYHFQVRNFIGKAGYEKWVKTLTPRV